HTRTIWITPAVITRAMRMVKARFSSDIRISKAVTIARGIPRMEAAAAANRISLPRAARDCCIASRRIKPGNDALRARAGFTRRVRVARVLVRHGVDHEVQSESIRLPG